MVALFARYEREVSECKKGAQPSEDRRRMELWTHFLGPERNVVLIDHSTINRFVRNRRAGKIELPQRRLKPNPSETTIGADIVFLQSVLNWATTVVKPDGTRLLEQNPIRGYDRPANKSPRQPLATFDRFVKLRKIADSVDPQRLFGSFIDLVVELGWRVTSICELRASDVDPKTARHPPNGRILKRAEVDKEEVEMWVPLTERARESLDTILRVHPTIGDGFLFPAPKKAEKPWSRWHARDLLERAEEAAGIDHLEGGAFHPFRRMWATERKHLPDKDVAAAGGWRDIESLRKSYQQVDEKTLLQVMTNPNRLLDTDVKP